MHFINHCCHYSVMLAALSLCDVSQVFVSLASSVCRGSSLHHNEASVVNYK